MSIIKRLDKLDKLDVLDILLSIFGLNLLLYSLLIPTKRLREGLKSMFCFFVQALVMIIAFYGSTYIIAYIVEYMISIFTPVDTMFSWLLITVAVTIVILGLIMTVIVGYKINSYFVKRLEQSYEKKWKKNIWEKMKKEHIIYLRSGN